MALLHQDNSRGGGGPQEHRRSLTDFLNFDPSQYAETAATNANPVKEGEEWRWLSPGSPEAAQSPRSLVPSACFPPRNAPAYASFSEGARPGSWAPESAGQDLTELVNSFKSLAMPPSPSSRRGSYQIRSTSELWMSQNGGPPQHTQNAVSALNMECSWAAEGRARREEGGEPEERGGREERDDARPLSRRASFCGVVSGGNSALRWSGVLPARGLDSSGGWSAKVFLGGLPWDITEQALVQALQSFQPVRVEWPGRDGSCAPRGFAYVTLESERRVRALLAASRRDGPDWYYRVSTRNPRAKEVQVIPWAVCDSNWVCAGGAGGAGGSAGGGSSVRLEKTRTVFVGALHGMMTASALASIMNELFSGVVYAGIDLDKSKYPIGSGRVTFNNVHSYVRAISAGYVEIRTDKFIKKIQVDPYLEDSMCSVCNLQQGPYFCRQPTCFKYFCRTCWARQHAAEGHKPLMRNSKSMQLMSLGSGCNGFTTGNDGNTATPSPPASGGDVERGEGTLLWSGFPSSRACLGD